MFFTRKTWPESAFEEELGIYLSVDILFPLKDWDLFF